MSETCQWRQESLDALVSRLYPSGERRPHTFTAELTRRCNFTCLHCYCNLPAAGPVPRPELTTAQWQRIIGEVAEQGVLFGLFTGGEPLLRDDFHDLWRFARRQGVLMTLFTNASLIDDETADLLAEWTPNEVSVTLYGASEETYQKVTGCVGMYEQVLAGLERLAARGIKLQVKSVLTRLNVHELTALREQSARYQDIFRWDAELVQAYAEGGGEPLGVRLGAEEILAIEQQDALRVAEWQNLIPKQVPALPSDSPFRCRISQGEFHVDPYGLLHPCLQLEAASLDLLQMTVAEAWAKVPDACRNLSHQRGPCQDCELAAICRLCPALGLLEGLEPGQPHDFHCQLAHLRMEHFGGMG